MNPTAIITMGMLYFKLNSGQSSQEQIVFQEGIDVIQSVAHAMKDNKITMAEKKALTKELKEFSKAAIKLLDDVQIPE